jgi:exodeoxyribonuclease VII small subunit
MEAIVKKLESGELPLEESLELFEQGMRLSAICRKRLEEAETRVETLVRRGTAVVAEPFKG